MELNNTALCAPKVSRSIRAFFQRNLWTKKTKKRKTFSFVSYSDPLCLICVFKTVLNIYITLFGFCFVLFICHKILRINNTKAFSQTFSGVDFLVLAQNLKVLKAIP